MTDYVNVDLSQSRNLIFEYANLTDAHKNNLGKLLDEYKELLDKNDSFSDDLRRVRKELSAYFYALYKAVFFESIEGSSRIPTEVFMFLYFGYIDENLAGKENAKALYLMADTLGFDEECKVFTFYQWLRLIYTGKKDPSVSEFSMDYAAYLRERRKNGEITADEEKRLYGDSRKRVEYEIDNMFKSANKVMTSAITSFCPFFSESSVFKPLGQMFVNFEAVHKTLNLLSAIDFSLFYRETVYTNPDKGIEREVIKLEVIPDVILMPVVGDRASMWQEITGAKRTTPGRFLLPIFETEELTKTMIKLCGEFRWELCRRIQGARWNDLSERSLTSDYFDYLATYRKNRDLSPEAREKIKSSLVKHRNSSREVFADDYLQYIMYESQGALRLNKVVRRILFAYCPFCKNIRDSLSSNPQYQKYIEIFNNKNGHAAHLFDISLGRLEKAEITPPKELLDYRDYLHK